MEEEKRRELRHILISYIPYGDLEYEVKDYENIINFIANYFKEKDYQYVIGRDTVINQKLKEECIPISVIQNKLEQNKAKTDCRYCNNACDSYAVCTVLQEILEKGNK